MTILNATQHSLIQVLVIHTAVFPVGASIEDLTIDDLQEIQARFEQLHQRKKKLVQSFLEPRQIVFLELLALIFHYNSAVLPGFISGSTPSGIQGYIPDLPAIRAARRFHRGFESSFEPPREWAIESLFIMGSVGSIAFSRHSDIDIWLCHQHGLAEESLQELQQKALAIESWAASFDLEVHFFLMDSENFRKGEDKPLSSESSGKTQHYLLLEEFYRTAIHIAGKIPAWWLVPPQQEATYPDCLRKLYSLGLVKPNDVIDFGGFNAVPATEFTSATLWHIYKSLHAPHKSLLKLLLMECYASEYPGTQWLCQDIKQAIYKGDFVNRDLDPYLLIYKKVERYLQRHQYHDRLELVRQCFYLKIMGSSNSPLDAQSRTVREQYMANLARNWHWPAATLVNLQKQQAWNIRKAVQEHAVILEQLHHCYRIIMRFAHRYVRQGHTDSDDIKLIGRKLRAFLDKRPGKIEIITTRSAVHVQETDLTLLQIPEGWGALAKQADFRLLDQAEAIYQSPALLEMLSWLVVNGLYHKQLQLHFSPYALAISKEELLAIVNAISLFLQKYLLHEDSLAAYQQPRTIVGALLVINLNSQPVIRDNGMMVLSEHSDVLSYGRNRHSLIETVDCLTLSSWSELTALNYRSAAGLFDCLVQLLNACHPDMTVEDVYFICQTPVRGRTILNRTQEIFNALFGLFRGRSAVAGARFVVTAETGGYLFRKNHETIAYEKLPAYPDLLDALARPTSQFSPVSFDSAALSNTAIPLIYSFNKPRIVQLFYTQEKAGITVFILDERGALFRQTHSQSSLQHLLNHYTSFLEAVLARNLHDTLLTLEYYEIRKNDVGVLSARLVHLQTQPSLSKLTLRISGETVKGVTTFTAYCNDQEFSSRHYGNQVFNAVYQYILQFRTSQTRYPVYISDIDLPLAAFHVEHPAQLQTIHYLNYKQKIEAKLNG